MPLTVRLTIRGDEIIADFTESAPMVRGALNCTPSFVEATRVPHGDGGLARPTFRAPAGAPPVTVVTKPGTVTHVVLPGASSMRGVTGYRLSDVMNGALAQLIPHRVPAAGEGGSTLAFFAGRVEGEPFLYSELVVGTWGGRPIADGNDGLANPCASIANIPVEVAESDWPILIERYGLVPDSGGAGRFRGGLAVERVWRVLVPGHCVHVRSDRQVHRPYGLAGGLEGGAVVDPAPPGGRARSSGCRRCSSQRSSRATSSTTGCRAAAAWAIHSTATREAVARTCSTRRSPLAAARELYGVASRRRRGRCRHRGLRRRRLCDAPARRSSHPRAATACGIVLGLEPVFPDARALGRA